MSVTVTSVQLLDDIEPGDISAVTITVVPDTTGPAGPQGDAGPAGADGDPGADGASAYEVAVADGFSGTETEWLASLVGPQGPAGADGAGVVATVVAPLVLTGDELSLDDSGFEVAGAAAAVQANVDALTAADVGALDQAAADGLYDALGAAAAAEAAAEATAAGALSAHEADTTSVHGIADTADLIVEGDSRLTDSRAPSGAAGGVLAGTYPNPSFASDMASQAELDAHAADTTSVHGITDTSALALTGDAPTAHAASHTDGGTDEITVAEAQVTGLTAALAAKAPLASPTFTGTPAAPTAAQGTNTTQVATTAYVQTEAGLLVPKSLVDAKGDLLVGSADNTVIRKAVGTDGQVLTADAASTGGVKWADAASGGGSVGAPVTVRYTGGDVTVTSGSNNVWTALTSGCDLVVPSLAAGDKVEIHMALVMKGALNAIFMDYATWVSSAAVNMVTADQGSPNDFPLPSWTAPSQSGDDYRVNGKYIYTVQSGDLVTGTVTFRLHAKRSNSTARQFYAGVATFFYATAQKIG